MEQTRYRMYFLVMYNLSEIQKGIQALHACVEYGLKYFNTEEYQAWANKEKTVILLNGGTSNRHGQNLYNDCQELGSMEYAELSLLEQNIPYASFHEPDLNNSTSALCLLMPEQVYDRKKYPDAPLGLDYLQSLYMPMAEKKELQKQKNIELYGERIVFLREFKDSFRSA